MTETKLIFRPWIKPKGYFKRLDAWNFPPLPLGWGLTFIHNGFHVSFSYRYEVWGRQFSDNDTNGATWDDDFICKLILYEGTTCCVEILNIYIWNHWPDFTFCANGEIRSVVSDIDIQYLKSNVAPKVTDNVTVNTLLCWLVPVQ